MQKKPPDHIFLSSPPSVEIPPFIVTLCINLVHGRADASLSRPLSRRRGNPSRPCSHAVAGLMTLTAGFPALPPYLDQAAPDRRLRRRQVVLLAALQRGFVHAVLHHHHRHRLQDQDHRARWQARQVADLGHGGPGTLPHHHHSLLPRRYGYPASIRCHR